MIRRRDRRSGSSCRRNPVRKREHCQGDAQMKTKSVYLLAGAGRPRCHEPLGGELGGRDRSGHDPDHERQDTVVRVDVGARGSRRGIWKSSGSALQRAPDDALHRPLRAALHVRRPPALAGLPRYVLPAEGPDHRRRVASLPAVLRSRRPGGTGLYDNARGTLVVTRMGVHPVRDRMVFRLVG